MCGIAGYWSENGAVAAIVERMATQLRHRGPDDSGVWIDERNGLALAHRRLSIIDLSQAGHQPMVSPCGRFTLIYNGEIYNHLELRSELEREGGHFDWQGHSDSETLLAALRHWGVEDALVRLNGMFAFALWDTAQRRLFLARDRLGEKPLYYGRCGGSFVFGSELKALTAHPEWRGDVDRDALVLYLRHNCVPSPRSIYQGVHKLPPAHFVVAEEYGNSLSSPRCYWDLRKIAERRPTVPAAGTEELIDELDALLRDAVRRRMAADVPLGAFLSGGFDSSTVTALMQAQSGRPIKTFTIGFHEPEHDEATHAKAVARHLGTDHTELYVSPTEAMEIVPRLPVIWDEPFSDMSQIPTFLLCQLARRHVTVSLSGDGGDELFCGYNRYTSGYQAWRRMRALPAPLRRAAQALIRSAPVAPLEALARHFPRLRVAQFANHLPKLANVMGLDTDRDYYRRVVSHWNDPTSLVLGGVEPSTHIDEPEPDLAEVQELMMYLDTLTYLPDDILTKVDRASMAVSLEARVPLLDHRVVEFAWSVPLSLKYRQGKGKWLLRELLYRYVPRNLMERPKMGFGVPISQWLRGPLREWAEELLDERRLLREGLFEPAPIRRMWHDHINGKPGLDHCLWDVLMFQAWHARGACR